MKQKVVIKVWMNDKSRTRAMKIAVSAPGVVAAELQGSDKNQIMVAGEGIDSTRLIMTIRKKVGFTELVSVAAIPGKKEEKMEEKKEEKKEVTAQPMMCTPYHVPPQLYWSDAPTHNQDGCTIM